MSADVAPATNGYGHEPVAADGAAFPDVNGNSGSEGDGDLFGDENEAAEENENSLDRKLDDSELDSGDDEGREDRVAATVEDDDIPDPQEQKEVKVMSVELARVKHPEGNELYALQMPAFLGLRHRNYDSATYEAPTKPHDGRDPATDPSVKFSAFSTAASTMYWRRDPKTPELLQSNSRIIKWSDGSLTLQMASNPKDHYRIGTNALRQTFDRRKNHGPVDYDPNRDTHHYLAAPHGSEGVDLQIVRPLDAAMKIQPSGDLADESVLKLKASLAAATKAHDPLNAIRQVTVNPEEARLKAEQFEKERIRMARKRENAEDRLLLRKDRVLGRSGLGRAGGGGGAGLSVAGLEDDDGMPTARGKKSSKMSAAARRRRTNRRGDIYSDDEDEDNPRGRTREDEYDREDDFLAASDEEPETYEDGEEEEEVLEGDDDDPDVDDLEIDGRQTVVKERTRGGRESTPKRPAKDIDDDGDAGDTAAGAVSAAPGSPQARKKRRVIDDDEDEE